MTRGVCSRESSTNELQAVDDKVVVTDERSSGSKAIIAPTARTPGGDLVSDADLDSDCSELVSDCVDDLTLTVFRFCCYQ